MSVGHNVATKFTAEDKYSTVLKKMTKSVSRFSKQGSAAVKRFDNKITNSVKNMGRISQLAVGLGLGTLFTAAIQNNIAYNDSLASVSAITGSYGKDLADLEKMSMRTANAQSMLGADVLKAYELIGSAKPELLTNAKLLDSVTNSAVTLSKAGRMELGPAAEALTTTLNQFGLGGESAKSVIDNLAAGAKFGSSSITNTSDALAKFGTIAAATGTKVNESIALVELVSPFEKGAEAGTKLRNVLSTMAGAEILPPAALSVLKNAGVDIDVVTDATQPLGVRLKEMAKVGKNATDVMQVFGKQNAALAQGIFDNVDGFDDMLLSINKTGVAQEQATTNSKTLQFGLDSVKNAFLNVTTATNDNSTVLNFLIQLFSDAAKHMGTIVSVAAGFIGAFIAMKALIIGMRVATFAYNIALGLNTALTSNNKRAIIGNTIATNAYKVAMGIGTAVTWLATAATTAFAFALNLGLWPIVLIVAAIAAAILIFKNWGAITAWFSDMFTAAADSIGSAWQSVVSWFTEFDFIGLFKSIGQSVLSFLLLPLKAVLFLLSKIPGSIGDMAKSGLGKIDELTGNVDTKATTEVISAPETRQENLTRESSAQVNGNINLNLRDPGKNIESADTDSTGVPITVTPTQGAY